MNVQHFLPFEIVFVSAFARKGENMNFGKRVTLSWAFVEFFRRGKKVRDVFFFAN